MNDWTGRMRTRTKNPSRSHREPGGHFIEISSPSGPARPAQELLSDLGVERHLDDSEVLGFIHQDERAVLSEAGQSGGTAVPRNPIHSSKA